jgi:hypothetical protein
MLIILRWHLPPHFYRRYIYEVHCAARQNQSGVACSAAQPSLVPQRTRSQSQPAPPQPTRCDTVHCMGFSVPQRRSSLCQDARLFIVCRDSSSCPWPRIQVCVGKCADPRREGDSSWGTLPGPALYTQTTGLSVSTWTGRFGKTGQDSRAARRASCLLIS